MLSDSIKRRYSVRTYQEKPVEKEKLIQILEAARLAPSACNNQPWHFVVFTGEQKINEVGEAYRGKWLTKAPAVIVICGDHGKSWKRFDGKDHCDIDAAIAIEHMALAAADLGLGTCWICAFDAKRCHEILGLPEHMEVIALLPVGYPLTDAVPDKDRASLEDIVSWEGYQKQTS